MKTVLLGGTKGMGRAVARELAARGGHLFLLGRDEEDLRRSATDLELSGAAGKVGTALCDLTRPEGFESALTVADDALGGFDTVIVTAGLFARQDALEDDPERTRQLLDVDFTHTILFCEAARRRLLARGGGTLCVFTSVAGDRGRKPAFLYGAAKAGLAHYLEGLDHKFHGAGLRVIDVRPGFVRTGMTAGLPEPPFAGDPEEVATLVVRALERGTPVVYAPAIWRWVLLVIRSLPRAVMRRIGF